MTASPSTPSHIPGGQNSPATPGSVTPRSGAPGSRRRRRLLAGGAVFGVVALAAGGALIGGVGRASAAVLTNCSAKPSSCGYPDATNTGVQAGTTLKTVPAQVSSGPGWSYNATNNDVVVTGNGTVLSGLSLSSELLINASNVTVKNVQIVASGGFGIALTHTTGVTIVNSAISGSAGAGRLSSAVEDVYGDSTGITLTANNISNYRTAIQISTGTVTGNYIHDPGYVSGDHTNGFYVNGGTQPLTISGNTILNSLGQTDAINLDAGTGGGSVTNKTVKNNLLAGGSYTIYGGAALSDPTSNIVITGNRFGQLYYAKSGQYGPIAYFDPTATGSQWSGNIWDTTGATIPSP
jgi:Right handed beta helix region